jgi:hypothetical protein
MCPFARGSNEKGNVIQLLFQYVDKRPESLFRSFSGLEGPRARQSGSVRRYESLFGVLPLPATVVGPPTCCLIGTYTVTLVRSFIPTQPAILSHIVRNYRFFRKVSRRAHVPEIPAPFLPDAYPTQPSFWISGFLAQPSRWSNVSHIHLTSPERLEPVQASKLVIQENKLRLSVLDSIGPPVVFFFRVGKLSRFGCIPGEVSGLSLVTASCNSAYYPIFGRFTVS